MHTRLASLTFDPTNDNGNGYFEIGENVAPLIGSIESELRKQLKLADSASYPSRRVCRWRRKLDRELGAI